MKALLAPLAAAALALPVEAQGRSIPQRTVSCADSAKVAAVQAALPRLFQKTAPDTYIIEVVPSTVGTRRAGRLSVYAPDGRLSIFDRTAPNTADWYNVANLGVRNLPIGCVDQQGIYLNASSPMYLSLDDSQRKFNDFIDRVYRQIPENK